MEVLQSKKLDLSPDEFQKATDVLLENQRVTEAYHALRGKDHNTFGKLLFESHVGLQYEYEVSCPELDFWLSLPVHLVMSSAQGLWGEDLSDAASM